MDNTGLYASIAKLAIEMANAGKGSKKKITLSAKTQVSGNRYSFTFAGDAPAVGDFLVQGDLLATIFSVTGTTLEAEDATDIDNGGSFSVQLADYLESDLTNLIQNAMDFIDRLAVVFPAAGRQSCKLETSF